jgi:ureidoacrylate peracid hydrolase
MRVHIESPFRNGGPALPALEGEHLALVLVDMQYFDAHADWGEGRTARQLGVLHAFDEYFEQINDVIPRIQSLLAACRGKGIEVIHLRVAELTKDSRDAGRNGIVRGLAVPKDSVEAELLEEVKPVGDEVVISKSSSGAFATTNLDRILRNMGINTLVFLGTSTGGCVESTACDAVDLGYRVIVASDACACATRRSHQTALERMAAGSICVSSTDEIQARLSTLPPVDRMARSGVARAKPHVPISATVGTSPENPYGLIFGPAIRLSLVPSTTALLIVDVQYFTCDPACGLGKLVHDRPRSPSVDAYYTRVRNAIPNIVQLLEAGRQSHLMVAFVRTAAQTMDGRDLAPRVRDLGVFPLVGSQEAEILADLAPQPGDVVLNKPAAGVCTGTGLDELLRNARIVTVVLTGISYDGAIEGSVRSLTDRGYGVVLVPDACATFDEHLQERLWNMETGIINVYPASEVVARLRVSQHAEVISRSSSP